MPLNSPEQGLMGGLLYLALIKPASAAISFSVTRFKGAGTRFAFLRGGDGLAEAV
jgi:hypothetical protein